MKCSRPKGLQALCQVKGPGRCGTASRVTRIAAPAPKLSKPLTSRLGAASSSLCTSAAPGGPSIRETSENAGATCRRRAAKPMGSALSLRHIQVIGPRLPTSINPAPNAIINPGSNAITGSGSTCKCRVAKSTGLWPETRAVTANGRGPRWPEATRTVQESVSACPGAKLPSQCCGVSPSGQFSSGGQLQFSCSKGVPDASSKRTIARKSKRSP